METAMGRCHCVLRVDESLDEEQIKQLLLAHPYKIVVKGNNEDLTAFFVVDNQVIKRELALKDLSELANAIPKHASQESYNRNLIKKLEATLKIPDLSEADKFPKARTGWEKLAQHIEDNLIRTGNLTRSLTLSGAVNTYQDNFDFLCRMCEFFMQFNYKQLTSEYKSENRLPNSIDELVDKMITIILTFVDEDQKLIINPNINQKIVRKILEKTSRTNPDLFDKLSKQYFPKILDTSNNESFALKFHTFHYDNRVETEETKSLELPQESIFSGRGIVLNPDSRMEQVKGNMFKIEENYDGIGYTLFLPRNDVKTKAIMIWVYGGRVVSEPNFLTGQLSDIDLYLLKEGIAVSYLNTPEREFYKSATSTQLEIGERGQKATNETITCFVKQLRENPGGLHEKCDVLKDVPIYLVGFSFGGSTVFRYQQMCDNPHIAGFISINGAISLEKIKLHERKDISSRWTKDANQAISWLSPEGSIRKKEYEKPALIVQNIKDTNSNVYNAISFFNKSKKAKINAVNIYFFDDDTNASATNFDHEIPQRGNRSFLKLSRTLCDFILKGGFDRNDSLNIEETKIKMAIYNYNKNINMRFVSYVYCYYPSDFEKVDEKDKGNIDKYDSILAGLFYANQILKSKNDTLKESIENDVNKLNELILSGKHNKNFIDKYLTTYLYFSIFNSVFCFLDYDKIQKIVEVAKDSSETLTYFLDIYQDIDFILDHNHLHLIENLYICFPELVPTDVYTQDDFLKFKNTAEKKFSQVYSKLEHASNQAYNI